MKNNNYQCWVKKIYKTKDFLKMLKKKSLHVDLDMQTEVRWKKDGDVAKDFGLSYLGGKASSDLHLADIRSCYNFAISINSESDVVYFKEFLNLGYRYLIIDGNNRINVGIKGLFDSIYPVKFDLQTLNPSISFTAGSTYDEFGNDQKNFIDNINISVTLYTKCTQHDLCDIFFGLNSGMPLNDGEKLNSFICQAGNGIRKLAKKLTAHGAPLIPGSGKKNKIERKRRFLNLKLAQIFFYTVIGRYSNNYSFNYVVSLYKDEYSILNTKIDDFCKEFFSFAESMLKVINEKLDGGNKSYLLKKPLGMIFDLFILWRESGRPTGETVCLSLYDRFHAAYEILDTDKSIYSTASGNQKLIFSELYGRVFDPHFIKLRMQQYSKHIPELVSYYNGISKIKIYTDVSNTDEDDRMSEAA